MLDIGQLPNNTDGVRTTHTCELCGFEPKTKNKYREKQDHLVMKHFKEQIEKIFPHSRPYLCPSMDCSYTGKDKQALLRHYTGKHGILEKFLRDALAEKGINYVCDNSSRRRGTNCNTHQSMLDRSSSKVSTSQNASVKQVDRLSPVINESIVNDFNSHQLCFVLPPTELQPQPHVQPQVVLQSRPNTEELRMEVAALMASFQPLESQMLYTQSQQTPTSVLGQISNNSILSINGSGSVEMNKINFLNNDVCNPINVTSITDAIVTTVSKPENNLMSGISSGGGEKRLHPSAVVTSMASTSLNKNETKNNNDMLSLCLKPTDPVTLTTTNEKLEVIYQELKLNENGNIVVDSIKQPSSSVSVVDNVEPQLPPISLICKETCELSNESINKLLNQPTSSIPSLILPTSVSTATVASIIENAEVMWGAPGPAVVVESANSMPITYIECADAAIVYTTALENIDYDFLSTTNEASGSPTLQVNNVSTVVTPTSDTVQERQLDFCML